MSYKQYSYRIDETVKLQYDIYFSSFDIFYKISERGKYIHGQHIGDYSKFLLL